MAFYSVGFSSSPAYWWANLCWKQHDFEQQLRRPSGLLF